MVRFVRELRQSMSPGTGLPSPPSSGLGHLNARYDGRDRYQTPIKYNYGVESGQHCSEVQDAASSHSDLSDLVCEELTCQQQLNLWKRRRKIAPKKDGSQMRKKRNPGISVVLEVGCPYRIDIPVPMSLLAITSVDKTTNLSIPNCRIFGEERFHFRFDSCFCHCLQSATQPTLRLIGSQTWSQTCACAEDG